jgi:hypothetical protein
MYRAIGITTITVIVVGGMILSANVAHMLMSSLGV